MGFRRILASFVSLFGIDDSEEIGSVTTHLDDHMLGNPTIDVKREEQVANLFGWLVFLTPPLKLGVE